MYDAHNDVLPDYSAMREALGEKYVILNKLHPFVEQNKAQTRLWRIHLCLRRKICRLMFACVRRIC